jgi:hypothetical protein
VTPCTPRHRRHCNHDHAWLVGSYRDARDAHEAYAGTNHQLEADELRQLPTHVTFKQWLVQHAGRNRQPA